MNKAKLTEDDKTKHTDKNKDRIEKKRKYKKIRIETRDAKKRKKKQQK